MKTNRKRLFSSRTDFIKPLLACIVALGVSSSAMALKSDRDQPADIEAEDTLFDFKTGKRTFIGNVIVIQGTLRIKADKVVANYKDGELQNATAWGKPARFKQRPDGKPNDVEGSGRKIYVNSIENTLLLTTRARLKQGGDTVNGESILYNMANDTLQVKGGAERPSGISTGGKSGKARPQRKLEDPFKDDPLPNSKPNKKKATAKGSSNKGSGGDSGGKNEVDSEVDSEVNDVIEESAPPVPVGRSRLIIQPKPKPKKEEETDSSAKKAKKNKKTLNKEGDTD